MRGAAGDDVLLLVAVDVERLGERQVALERRQVLLGALDEVEGADVLFLVDDPDVLPALVTEDLLEHRGRGVVPVLPAHRALGVEHRQVGQTATAGVLGGVHAGVVLRGCGQAAVDDVQAPGAGTVLRVVGVPLGGV